MKASKEDSHSNRRVLVYFFLPIVFLFLLPLSGANSTNLTKSLKEINAKISSNPTINKLSDDGKHFYEKWCERSKRSLNQSHAFFRKASYGISEFGRYSKILFHAIFGDSSFASEKSSD